MSDAPSAANHFRADRAALIVASYRRLTGRDLLDPALDAADAARALYMAPFAVLAHDAGADPLFTYANLTAQRLFEMPWASIVGLPSRQSAEPLARAERQRLLDAVAACGYIDDYVGVRTSSSGRRFRVEGATVWNLIDATGAYRGQAACFATWRELPA